jgi:hypothetical protein
VFVWLHDWELPNLNEFNINTISNFESL